MVLPERRGDPERKASLAVGFVQILCPVSDLGHLELDATEH